MNVDCKELEKLLSERISELPSSVAAHIRECPTCAKEWEAWQDIAEAAPKLRKRWGRRRPEFWPRIRRSLEAEAERAERQRWWHAGPFRLLRPHWQVATAALVLVLSSLGGWMMLRPSQHHPSAETGKHRTRAAVATCQCGLNRRNGPACHQRCRSALSASASKDAGCAARVRGFPTACAALGLLQQYPARLPILWHRWDIPERVRRQSWGAR